MIETGANSVLLVLKGLEKAYHLGQTHLPVLDGLNLHVQAGEMVVIMGPSGSGKTTLLNCVSGIDVPDHGEVWLSGGSVDYGSEAARTRLRRHHIGIVFQFFNLIPTLTVHENVALPLLIAKSHDPTSHQRVDTLLERVGLGARRGHYPFQLSGGEMQLTSIARALAHAPDLLLADEPTGNVNPAVGRRIMDILRAVTKQQGTGVVMVTHSPDHAAWADRICFLRDGEIAAEHYQGGRKDDVLAIHEQLLSLGI